MGNLMSSHDTPPSTTRKNPATAGGESLPSNTNDTPNHAIVKEKYLGSSAKRSYSVRLQGHVLWALEEYAKENNLSNPNAFRDLLEFRLFQLGKLPSWWYERGEILRKRGGTHK